MPFSSTIGVESRSVEFISVTEASNSVVFSVLLSSVLTTFTDVEASSLSIELLGMWSICSLVRSLDVTSQIAVFVTAG